MKLHYFIFLFKINFLICSCQIENNFLMNKKNKDILDVYQFVSKTGFFPREKTDYQINSKWKQDINYKKRQKEFFAAVNDEKLNILKSDRDILKKFAINNKALLKFHNHDINQLFNLFIKKFFCQKNTSKETKYNYLIDNCLKKWNSNINQHEIKLLIKNYLNYTFENLREIISDYHQELCNLYPKAQNLLYPYFEKNLLYFLEKEKFDLILKLKLLPILNFNKDAKKYKKNPDLKKIINNKNFFDDLIINNEKQTSLIESTKNKNYENTKFIISLRFHTSQAKINLVEGYIRQKHINITEVISRIILKYCYYINDRKEFKFRDISDNDFWSYLYKSSQVDEYKNSIDICEIFKLSDIRFCNRKLYIDFISPMLLKFHKEKCDCDLKKGAKKDIDRNCKDIYWS